MSTQAIARPHNEAGIFSQLPHGPFSASPADCPFARSDYKRSNHRTSRISNAVTDSELVASARRNDQEAFGELIRRHHTQCLQLATHMLGNRAEAEEKVQDAYLKAFEHLNQFRGVAEFSSWLFRIVSNQCVMLLRSRARLARYRRLNATSARLNELHAGVMDPECELIRSETIATVQREIAHMPRIFRRVIVLSDVQELPLESVARRLGITLPAAKSRLFRARIQLSQRIHAVWGLCDLHQTPSAVRNLPARAATCPPLGDR
jgi:RNA polymerase sigma-70 factor, ECF subfamily